MLKTVLIADDHPIIREKLRHMFEQSQEWNVAEATDGRDAVEKATRLEPDLVVLDFRMPLMNGLEAAAAMKRARPRLPLILFTAYKDEVLEKLAFSKGFSVVVSKSEAANRLVDSARILLKHFTEAPAQSESILRKAKAGEARAHARIALDIEATVYSTRHGFIPARVSDISAGGFAGTLPVELSLGEVVDVELHLPFEVKRVQAVVRNRNVFRHGFELFRSTLANEMKKLMEGSSA